ncbi:MAG: EamA family transporter [Deltaproteobacteria bacterium]
MASTRYHDGLPPGTSVAGDFRRGAGFVLAGVIFMRSLARVPAAHASVLTLIEPVTALSIAALAWGEQLHPLGLLGGAAILVAGYLVVR